jgi:hypothetical protein
VTALLRSRNYQVREVTGRAATKAGMLAAFGADRAALVFTATHGAGYNAEDAPGSGAQAVNGAWACAPAAPGRPANAWDWLCANELAGPVAPGGLVFQFACFGYGTTDRSSFAAWLGNRNVVTAKEPFVAAIPQRLLADPDGPLGFIGHVDIALAHGFVDPGGGVPAGGVHPRAQAFLSVLRKAVIELAPVGFALRDLNERATMLASQLVSTFDGLEQAGLLAADLGPADRAELIDKVIRRNDAMHFLLLGDPAVRVRIDA